jgi:hypothetical protein
MSTASSAQVFGEYEAEDVEDTAIFGRAHGVVPIGAFSGNST